MKKTIPEIVAIMKKNSPKKFAKIDEKIMTRVIKELFNTLKDDIENMTEDNMKIIGLGNFRRQKIIKDGKSIRKIIFRPITSDNKNKKS